MDDLSDVDFARAWDALSHDEQMDLGVERWARRQEIKAGRPVGPKHKPNGKGGNGHDYEYYDPGPEPEPRAAPEPESGRPAIRNPLDWPTLSALEPPARQWAINGWVGMGHVTLMVGSGGIGKSLLAQQLGSAIALGHGFIDQIPQERKVLMWACEDDHDEIWRRQIAISVWLKVALSAFAPALIIEPRHGLSNTMVSTEFGRPMLTNLIDELATQANDYAAEVVILDNAAQVYGANENDRHAVTMFLNALSGRMPGKAIILLAHPSRGAGSEFSGSSAWENTARTRLYLGANLPDHPKGEHDDEAPDTVRYLSRRKANYSAKDYRKFNYVNGVLVQDMTEGADGIVGAARNAKALRVVLAGLSALSAKDVAATDSKTSPRYLPRLIIDYKLSEGVGQRDLASAMRVLVMDGSIGRGEIGRNASRHPIYGLKPLLKPLR